MPAKTLPADFVQSTNFGKQLEVSYQAIDHDAQRMELVFSALVGSERAQLRAVIDASGMTVTKLNGDQASPATKGALAGITFSHGLVNASKAPTAALVNLIDSNIDDWVSGDQ